MRDVSTASATGAAKDARPSAETVTSTNAKLDVPVVFLAHPLCKTYRIGEVEIHALRDVEAGTRRGAVEHSFGVPAVEKRCLAAHMQVRRRLGGAGIGHLVEENAKLAGESERLSQWKASGARHIGAVAGGVLRDERRARAAVLPDFLQAHVAGLRSEVFGQPVRIASPPGDPSPLSGQGRPVPDSGEAVAFGARLKDWPAMRAPCPVTQAKAFSRGARSRQTPPPSQNHHRLLPGAAWSHACAPSWQSRRRCRSPAWPSTQ